LVVALFFSFGSTPVPELTFQLDKVEPLLFAASPQLVFKVRITSASQEPIHTIALRCQVRIEPARRQYQGEEPARLRELFGTRERWGQTLKSMLWTHTSAIVPAFTGATVADVPVPCTFDFNIAATKYFDALQEGEVPLLLLFSGTVFFAAEDGALQVAQVPWSAEAPFRLPVAVWKEMMEHYYPNSAWLCLRKDVFDRLHRFKVDAGLPTWEQTLESLLAGRDRP
jgi:hypothetical protein